MGQAGQGDGAWSPPTGATEYGVIASQVIWGQQQSPHSASLTFNPSAQQRKGAVPGSCAAPRSS